MILSSIFVIAIAIVGARINLLEYFRISLLFFVGGTFLIAFQGLFRSGEGIDFLVLHFSYEGMSLGLAIALRTFGLVATGLSFSQTTRPKDMALSLIQIGLSYRIAHVAYLALRFLPILEADLQALNDAQQLRGVKRGWGKIKSTVIALIATQLRQSEETAIALETRGFGLHDTQTKLEEVRISMVGVILVVLTLMLIIVGGLTVPNSN